MDKVIYRRAANVDAHLALADRFEGFFSSGQCVVDFHDGLPAKQFISKAYYTIIFKYVKKSFYGIRTYLSSDGVPYTFFPFTVL